MSIILSFAVFSAYSQTPDYNDDFDDEAARKKEQQFINKDDPLNPDPYYEKNIKGSWEKDRERKIKETIEDLKKEYGTDKFTKEILEKGPVKKKEKSQDTSNLMSTSDPYYEENIKSSWQKEDEEIKRQILEKIRMKVSGEQKKKPSESGSTSMSPSSDEYYEENIKNSWKKQRKEIVDGALQNLLEDEAIETPEQRKKRLEAEKKEKNEEKE